MNPPNKQAIRTEIAKLQEKLKVIEEQEKLENLTKDFKKIIYKNKEFRIYKWENKPFKNFPIPEGFNWSEYFDFVKLINEDKIELEQYPSCYYTKSQFKQNLKDYGLSRLCLGWGLNLRSSGEGLAGSDADGRVVVVRSLK